MEIKIGVQNVSREIVVETDQSAEDLATQVSKSIADKTDLVVKDTKGRTIIVPGSVLGYVEIGASESRPVGFAVR